MADRATSLVESQFSFAQNFENLMLKYNFMGMRFNPHEVRSNTEELGKIR